MFDSFEGIATVVIMFVVIAGALFLFPFFMNQDEFDTDFTNDTHYDEIEENVGDVSEALVNRVPVLGDLWNWVVLLLIVLGVIFVGGIIISIVFRPHRF